MIQTRALTEADWNSGDQPWLIDAIAPFGGLDEAVVDLKQTIFPDRPIKALRPAPDGKGMTVVEW